MVLRIQMPEDVANDLDNAGFVASRTDVMTKGLNPVVVALIAYSVPLTIVNVAELPGRVIALRDSFLRWITGPSAPDKPYTLQANGPGGNFDYELDDPPDLEALNRPGSSGDFRTWKSHATLA